MTLAIEQIQDLASRELDDAEIAGVIDELEPNFVGVRLGVGLIGGLAVLKQELEAPLRLPAGQHIQSVTAEHDDRRLRVSMASRGAGGMGFYNVLIDDDYQPYPKSVVSLAGKLSYCVARERTLPLVPADRQ